MSPGTLALVPLPVIVLELIGVGDPGRYHVTVLLAISASGNDDPSVYKDVFVHVKLAVVPAARAAPGTNKTLVVAPMAISVSKKLFMDCLPYK
jgi:hypothetical protein